MMLKNNKLLLFILVFLPVQSDQIATVLVHGLGGCPNRIANLCKNLSAGTETIVPIFDDYAGARHKIHYDKVSCGGQNDIETIVKACYQTDKPLHLIGHSRGAMAICNALASGQIKNKVVALTLFCPPLCVSDILSYSLSKWFFGYEPSSSLVHFLEKYAVSLVYKQYNYKQIQPIDSPKYIKDKNIKITIIASERDRLVPVSSINKLADSFVKAGHKNVSLVVLPYGGHNSFWYKNVKKIIEVQKSIRKSLNLPSILFSFKKTKHIFKENF